MGGNREWGVQEREFRVTSTLSIYPTISLVGLSDAPLVRSFITAIFYSQKLHRPSGHTRKPLTDEWVKSRTRVGGRVYPSSGHFGVGRRVDVGRARIGHVGTRQATVAQGGRIQTRFDSVEYLLFVTFGLRD